MWFMIPLWIVSHVYVFTHVLNKMYFKRLKVNVKKGESLILSFPVISEKKKKKLKHPSIVLNVYAQRLDLSLYFKIDYG